MRSLPLVCLLALVGCSAQPPEETRDTDDAIVGGNLESLDRYPAAGYLVFKILTGPHAGEIWRPNCGAMLIAPNAIVTAAHCIEEKTGQDRTTVAVGFGDGHTGTTYDVVGTWTDWTHPRALFDVEFGGQTYTTIDSRYDVAVIQLARPVTNIKPLPLTNRSIAAKESALVIGYGRVQEGKHEEIDDVPNRPDHRDRYPGLRKSADLEVVIARDLIDAYPKPSTKLRKSGGICFADSGSSLIMADGTVAGVLAKWPDEDTEAEFFDGVPRCRTDNGGSWANLQSAENSSFVAARLAVAAAALKAGTP